jgi:hypothetical protein
MSLRDKAWSPYAAGVLIGLLQIPAFLLIGTALGTSSSYVTIAAHIASFADASIDKMDYLAKHMYGAKNLWQLAMVAGIAVGALVSATLSRTRRRSISPVWRRAVGIESCQPRADGLCRRLHYGARRAHRRWLHHGPRHLRQPSLRSGPPSPSPPCSPAALPSLR